MPAAPAPLGWFGIARLGCVQACLGAVVVLTTSTLNRVMVVELALPAVVPGALVALHYLVQALRPRFGHGSDLGRRRTAWIVGGMALLAGGGIVAALATALMARSLSAGIALALVGFLAVGLGVGASGTSLLVLLGQRVAPGRRAPAATIVWLMMIAGIAVTATLTGRALEPFSATRLIEVACAVAGIAITLTLLAVWGVEGPAAPRPPAGAMADPGFRHALAEVWRDAQARRFALFVFVSMLAYSAQELVLEPFAGAVFALAPGETARLTGAQHGGVLAGMVLVAVAGSLAGGFRARAMRRWTMGGCLASAGAILILAVGGLQGAGWPLRANVFALGAANGAFAVSAIGAMMGLAHAGRHGDGEGRPGVRMGLWGAAQALAFGAGGLLGPGVSDLARAVAGAPATAYGIVFVIEALIFLVAAGLAARVFQNRAERTEPAPGEAGLSVQPNQATEGTMSQAETFDAIVVGGGPAGATAAHDLARSGRSVLLLDREGRIKPCGGAIPPRLIKDFEIPDHLLVARVRSARMVSPSDQQVDMPIDGGFVGMVDREVFDPFLRARAEASGAVRRVGTCERVEDEPDGAARVIYTDAHGQTVQARGRVVIAADGARSAIAKQRVKGGDKVRCVFAYHEIIRSPRQGEPGGAGSFDGARCDVYYQGALSPDFYGWVFPHGATTSVGSGSARKGFSLRQSVGALRRQAGLHGQETIRREGAPIPMKPLKRWDDGRNVVLAGDAAGVVAPASGEGIYYAMAGGRMAAEAAGAFLTTGDARALGLARKQFMKLHGRVFLILGIMQWFWYANDKRREHFVKICRDKDVQRLTWESYMNKELVRKSPAAHVRIFFKDMAHLLGLAEA